METPHILALGVFTSYFVIILALFTTILRSIPAAGKTTSAGKTWLFRFLTLGSLGHTWFYMFKFMAWSFDNYESLHPTTSSAPSLERLTSWLLNTSLFEQAWAAVCFGPVNWWWSEQLCVYTIVWTLFLVVEGRSHKIKHLWAYMLLGQLVAISVASNLFYLALSRSTPRASKSQSRVAALVSAPLLFSLLTIIVSPHTDTRTFLPNLLTMHALLVVPLLVASPLSSAKRPSTIPLGKLITLISLSTALLRFRTDVVAAFAVAGRSPPSLSLSSILPSTPLLPDTPSPSPLHVLIHFIKALVRPVPAFLATPVSDLTSSVTGFVAAALAEVWGTLHAHPAQSSIGWDVVWTSVSLGAWVLSGGHVGGAGFADTKGAEKPKRRGRQGRVGRGVFVPLVGFPGLVSVLTEPWGARVGGDGVKRE